MKYCISNRQPHQVLSKADEIKVRFNDQKRIANYINDYPDKTIILSIPKDAPKDELDWTKYAEWASTGRFIVAIKSFQYLDLCTSLKIPFYWDYPIFSWYELRAIIDLKPSYIILTAPLFFQLEKVKAITDIPIRAFPNVAYDSYIPHQDGICGTWIRPEDTEKYEKYISTFEFYEDDAAKEEVLRHIYQDNKSYPGNLTLLIKNLNEPVDNRAFRDDFAEQRMNCGQRCKENNACHYCHNSFKYADVLRKMIQIKKKIEAGEQQET